MDIVPIFALLIGIASFFLPLGVLKENRVVEGLPVNGFALENPILLIVHVVVILAIIWAAFRRDKIVCLASGMTIFWVAWILLVRSTGLLNSGLSPRVSPSAGFWGQMVAAYILINHAKPIRGKGRHFLLVLILLGPLFLIFYGHQAESISIVQEFISRKQRFLAESGIHLRIVFMTIFLAALLGIPLGIAASGRKRLSAPIIVFVDGAQTIPSMALFGLLMAPLAALATKFPFLKSMGISGVGFAPALIALTMYSLLPIVRNTLTGLTNVPDAVLESGRGMGMTSKQLFWQVKWPMALPYILTGLRTASVQSVGNAAVAALIGSGGLGLLIFQGLGQGAPDLILLGVIPLILLAIMVDRIWDSLMKVSISEGLK